MSVQGSVASSAPARAEDTRVSRWVGFFHALDAWTEYWDIYHPETRGRFYFGDGLAEQGLLGRFLPRDGRPLPFTTWVAWALRRGTADAFRQAIAEPAVASALLEVDGLIARLFAEHFGDPTLASTQQDYLDAMFAFAVNSLPPATERYNRIPEDDPRRPTAGHHTLEGDIMWFAWALQTEGAELAGSMRNAPGDPSDHARRSLLLAGTALGCGANFAWKGHRYTRAEYKRDDATRILLLERGRSWAGDFAAGAEEMRALFRIREWGEDVTGTG